MTSRDFGNYQAIGFAIDGKLVAGAVFNAWYPERCVVELSVAATTPRWMTLKSLSALGAFPFDGLGCQMVVIRTSEHNTRVRSIAKRLGFTETLIPRMRGRNEAEAVCCLTVEAWKARKLHVRENARAITESG